MTELYNLLTLFAVHNKGLFDRPVLPGLSYKQLGGWLTNWVTHPFSCKLQKAWSTNRWENVYSSSLPVVTCHMLSGLSHKACVMCPFLFDKLYLQPIYLLKSVDSNIKQKTPENKICLNNLHTTTNYTIVHTISLHFIAQQCTVVQRNVLDHTVMHFTLFQHFTVLICTKLHK